MRQNESFFHTGYEAAVSEFEKEPLTFLKIPQRRLLAARALSVLGRSQEALRLVLGMTHDDTASSTLPEILEVIGDCYTDLARYRSALNAYKQSLDLHIARNGDCVNVLRKFLFTAVRSYHREAFRSALKQASRLSVQQSLIEYLASELHYLRSYRKPLWEPYLVGSAVYAPAEMFPALSKAIALFTQGDLYLAQDIFLSALQEIPYCFSLWYYVAEINERLGEGIRAEAILREASERYPHSWRLHYRLALCAWRQENYSKTEDYLQLALAIYPESAEAWLLLGGVFRKQGKVEHAMKCFQKAISFSRRHGFPLSVRDTGFAHGGLGGLALSRGQLLLGAFHSLCSLWHIFRFVFLSRSAISSFETTIRKYFSVKGT